MQKNNRIYDKVIDKKIVLNYSNGSQVKKNGKHKKGCHNNTRTCIHLWLPYFCHCCWLFFSCNKIYCVMSIEQMSLNFASMRRFDVFIWQIRRIWVLSSQPKRIRLNWSTNCHVINLSNNFGLMKMLHSTMIFNASPTTVFYFAASRSITYSFWYKLSFSFLLIAFSNLVPNKVYFHQKFLLIAFMC